MTVTEIICMPNTLKIARFYGVFPQKGRELNPGKYHYCRLALMTSTGLVVLIGSLLHLLKSMSAKVYTNLDTDLMYTLSLGATFFFTSAFVYRSEALAELYMFFSDFEEFGKPIHFDEDNKFYNVFSKLFYTLLQILLLGIVAFSTLYNFKNCEKNNLKYGLNEVCGLFSYTWMPFNFDYVPMKQIFLVIQMLGAYYFYLAAGMCGSGLIFETVQHLRIRIRHVNYLFREAVQETDPKKCREKFNFAVRYHSSLFSLEDKLNGVFGICMCTNLVLTAPILGIGAFAILSGGAISNFLVSVGWFSGLALNCIAGQWLQDECLAIGTDLYEADWLHCTEDMKKDIMVVIQRTWTPMNMRAASFGIMDYRMFLGVVKASYSYITLLTQSN